MGRCWSNPWDQQATPILFTKLGSPVKGAAENGPGESPALLTLPSIVSVTESESPHLGPGSVSEVMLVALDQGPFRVLSFPWSKALPPAAWAVPGAELSCLPVRSVLGAALTYPRCPGLVVPCAPASPPQLASSRSHSWRPSGSLGFGAGHRGVQSPPPPWEILAAPPAIPKSPSLPLENGPQEDTEVPAWIQTRKQEPRLVPLCRSPRVGPGLLPAPGLGAHTGVCLPTALNSAVTRSASQT